MDTMVSRALSVHQGHELLLRLEKAGLDSRLAQQVIDSKDNHLASCVVQQITDAARQNPPVGTSRLVTTLTVTCEGNAAASQLVQSGKYDWSSNLITDLCFPIHPHDPVTSELEFFQFDHAPLWEEVIAERRRRGLNEPTYEQGLYLGIQHPEEQHKHVIVITHQPVRAPVGDSRVLVLYGRAGYRGLFLDCPARGWRHDYVFAGLRK